MRPEQSHLNAQPAVFIERSSRAYEYRCGGRWRICWKSTSVLPYSRTPVLPHSRTPALSRPADECPMLSPRPTWRTPQRYGLRDAHPSQRGWPKLNSSAERWVVVAERSDIHGEHSAARLPATVKI